MLNTLIDATRPAHGSHMLHYCDLASICFDKTFRSGGSFQRPSHSFDYTRQMLGLGTLELYYYMSIWVFLRQPGTRRSAYTLMVLMYLIHRSLVQARQWLLPSAAPSVHFPFHFDKGDILRKVTAWAGIRTQNVSDPKSYKSFTVVPHTPLDTNDEK